MATIAEILLEQGRAAAEARRAQGAIWGNALAGIGNTIGSSIQQANDPRRQLEQVQLSEAQRGQQARAALGSAVSSTPHVDENGLSVYDIPTISKKLEDAGFGDHVGDVASNLTAINNSFRAEQQAKLAVVQRGAQALLQAGGDPDLTTHFIDTLEKNGTFTKDQLDFYRQQIAADPTKTSAILQQFAGPSKLGTAAPGSTIYDETSGKTVRTVPDKAEKPTKFSLAADSVDLTKTPEERAAAKAALAAGEPAAHSTAEADDERYRNIQAAVNQQQPVAPADMAWAQGYEKQKTLGVDKTAAAAADRQTATIGAQVAQQKRAQDFTQLQAARTDIEKNVNTPYLTAKTSANTLRDVVTAAQAGNKVAASMQALETTMAAIRAQGLNRINKTETDMAGNAGSMFDRVSGWMGKAVAGQPVPADIQKDMLSFADILENAAYKKYLAGHKASTDLYGVTSTLKPSLPAPVPSGPAPTVLTPGLQGLSQRP